MSRLMKLRVMSQEMRVFGLLLIVWLFSVTGSEGSLIMRPSHLVLVNGESAAMNCTSNKSFPTWKQDDWSKKNTNVVADDECTLRDKQSYDVSKIQGSGRFTCDLIIKTTAVFYSSGLTTRHTCSDGTSSSGEADTSTFQMIVMALESPLTCEAQDNELSCTLQHSAYMNTTGAMVQYLKILLVLKDPTGSVVSSKSAGFADNKTVVTAALNAGETLSTASPYLCSATFEVHCDSDYSRNECFDEITIIPPGAAECRYPEDRKQGKPIGLEVAKGVEATQLTICNPSKAKLERDGINALAILTSLLVAFSLADST